MCSWLGWRESVLEIPRLEPAELWQEAVWCAMFRIKCLAFQVSQAPSEASGLLRDLVWVSFKWCPWMWLLFAFHSNIYYKAFRRGNLPVKGAKLAGFKDSSFMHSRDTKQGSVCTGQTLDSKPVGAGHQVPLSLHWGWGPIYLPPPNSAYPLHTEHLLYHSFANKCTRLGIYK